MDPEDLREVISAYQKCVAEIVQRFGEWEPISRCIANAASTASVQCVAHSNSTPNSAMMPSPFVLLM